MGQASGAEALYPSTCALGERTSQAAEGSDTGVAYPVTSSAGTLNSSPLL